MVRQLLPNLNKDTSYVLEFGSGMSTAWYAQRAAHVVSMEDNKGWHARNHDTLTAMGNVDHIFCETRDDYFALPEKFKDQKFDLIMVDGTARDECIKFGLSRLAEGGMLYLDNSDMHGNHVVGDIPQARKDLYAYAYETGRTIVSFTDFAPTQLFVNEGTIIYNDVS